MRLLFEALKLIFLKLSCKIHLTPISEMKKSIILLLAITITVKLFAQDKVRLGNLILKLNYSQVNSRQFVGNYADPNHSLFEQFYGKNAQYNLEGLYQFNKFITSGLYMGYSNGTYISNEFIYADEDQIVYTMDKLGKSLFYGLKANFHILPLIFDIDKMRIDLYLPFQAGLVTQQIMDLKTGIKNWDSPFMEFGGGLGIGYNFTKNLGVHGEYLLGNYFNQRNTQCKLGLSFKF